MDSLWSKTQSRTWLRPIQVHYWVKQPGKKSLAASLKSKSSMGQSWTENSKAVINFSPHCSHHLHWGLWGKSTASLCSVRTATGGFEFSPLTYSHKHYMSLAETHWQDDCDLRGRESERAWACLRKCERRKDPNTSHTNSLLGSDCIQTHNDSHHPPHCPIWHPRCEMAMSFLY